MGQLAWTIVACACMAYCVAGLTEKDLIRKLLDEETYEKRARPVKDLKRPIRVNVTFDYAQLLDVYEKEQVLSSEIWLIQEWYDEHLTWDPADYGGLNYTVLRADDIWLPDIYIQNSVSGTDNKMNTFVPGDSGIPVQVRHNGYIQRIPAFLLFSSCQIDIKNFPFDTQKCPVIVSTWSYTSNTVELEKSEHAVSNDQKFMNNEWEVITVTAERTVTEYACCPGIKYAELLYTVFLRRRPLFYVVNIILPSVMLHVLATCTFILPPDSGERIGLGLTTFLAYSVFTLIVAEKVPDSSTSTPLITCYLTVCMAANMVAVVWSVYAVRCWLRPPKERTSYGTITKIAKKIAVITWLNHPNRLYSGEPVEPDKNGSYEKCETNEGAAAEQTSSNLDISEWHLIIEVIDRILFILFTLLLVVSLVVIVCIVPLVNYAHEDALVAEMKADGLGH